MLLHWLQTRSAEGLETLKNQEIRLGKNRQPLLIRSDTIRAWLSRLDRQTNHDDQVLEIAERLQTEPELQEFLYRILLDAPEGLQTIELTEDAIAFWEKHPGWWSQNVESLFEAGQTELRGRIPEGEIRLNYDIVVGGAKGAYGFGKGLVTGIAGLFEFAYLLSTDVKTQQATVRFFEKGLRLYIQLRFGSPSQQRDALKEISDRANEMFDAVRKQLKEEWEKAEEEGTEAQLAAEWGVRGVLEIATVLLPFLKGAQAVAQTGKAARAGAVVSELDHATDVARAAKKIIPENSPKRLWKNMKVNRSPATRKRAVQKWYKQYFEWRRHPTKKRVQLIREHMRGTNFNHKIYIRKFKKGHVIEQWVRREGFPGKYFADPGSTMDGLGIHGDRVLKKFKVIRDFEGLDTMAAKLEKTKIPSSAIGGAGGERQLIVPEDWKHYLLPLD